MTMTAKTASVATAISGVLVGVATFLGTSTVAGLLAGAAGVGFAWQIHTGSIRPGWAWLGAADP